MRRFLFLQIFLLALLPINGQELTVKSFVAKTNDLSASTHERKDLNGVSCALIKVQLAIDGAEFSPNIMGNIDYKEEEYWVYLPTMSKHLEVKHPDFLPLDVVFADYGIKLEPKTTYSLALSLPKTGYGSVSVAVLPDESDVYIDDKKVGVTPLLLQNILVGSHKLEVKKKGYQPYEENVNVQEGQTYSIENKDLSYFTFTVNGISSEMVRVEAGTFMMGATPEMGFGDSVHEPVHKVTLTNNYYMGKYEVTQALWKAVMGSNPSNCKGDKLKLPVENVSWNDCQKFISKLNDLTGKEFRLPTEAEWEYAARGGNKTKGYRYSGSNNLSDVKGHRDDNKGLTYPVGTSQPNELGIYDMSGNVQEWCQDWYGDYSSSAQTNPKGPTSGTDRVCRGGSYCHAADFWRSSSRTGNIAACKVSYLGLRLCLSE